MKNVLLKLYDGEICPFESSSSKALESRDSMREFYKRYDGFAKKLSELDPPLDINFEELIDDMLEAVCAELGEKFAEGFRLGAKIMLEVLR